MKVAYEEKLTENTIHAHGGFVQKPEKVGTVILTLGQFQQMYDLDLSPEDKIHMLIESCTIGKRKMEKYMPLLKDSKIAHLEQSNDIFVVGCLTGQRYSDYKRLSAKMIMEMDGMHFVAIVQQRTRKLVVIPLKERVVEILLKYGDEGLPDLNITKVNNCLHLIGELLHCTWKPTFNGNPPHSPNGIRFYEPDNHAYSKMQLCHQCL